MDGKGVQHIFAFFGGVLGCELFLWTPASGGGPAIHHSSPLLSGGSCSGGFRSRQNGLCIVAAGRTAVRPSRSERDSLLVERNALYLGDGRCPFRPCFGGKSIASKRDWSGILELFRPTVFEWDPSGAHQRDADFSGVLGGLLFFLLGGDCEGETGCRFFLCRPPGFFRNASGTGNCNSYGGNSNNRFFTEH